jgi:hypothetical protein
VLPPVEARYGIPTRADDVEAVEDSGDLDSGLEGLGRRHGEKQRIHDRDALLPWEEIHRVVFAQHEGPYLL